MPEGHGAQLDGVAPPLWHFTCDHCAPSIVAAGALVPHQQPLFPLLSPLVFLTDDPTLGRADLGLTSTHLSCDRMAHRFSALDVEHCFRWDTLVAFAPPWVMPEVLVRRLENARQPMHWWVSALPVPVVLG